MASKGCNDLTYKSLHPLFLNQKQLPNPPTLLALTIRFIFFEKK